MQEEEERERLIQEKLKAIQTSAEQQPTEIDEEDLKVAVQAQYQVIEKNTTYLTLMEQIEEKERERAEKEQVYKEEAYEEIKLSDDKQAQVDARKKELEAMLANM